MERAHLMAALPTLDRDLNIASNTAVARLALWRAAPPPLSARVSVANTAAAEKINAGLQNAHPYQSASASFARRMVDTASAHTHQDATRLHSNFVATVTNTPASKWLASGLLQAALTQSSADIQTYRDGSNVNGFGQPFPDHLSRKILFIL